MELLRLTEDEFDRIAKVVYDKTGIYLSPEKRAMLSNRLRKRLRALGLPAFEDYYRLISSKQGVEEELPHFLSAVTTNETYFFRNDTLWKFFVEELIPHFVETCGTRRSLRIWSAASSTGEEAYTTAIALRERLPQFLLSQFVARLGNEHSCPLQMRVHRGILFFKARGKVTSRPLVVTV